MYQYMLDLVGLLDSDANTHTVHAGLNEDLLILITGNSQRIEEDFWGTGGLDLWNVMPLRRLGSEVGDGESGRERRPDALEIGTQ